MTPGQVIALIAIPLILGVIVALVLSDSDPTEHHPFFGCCKHWDEDTRLCRIYEDRPAICRDFPYGRDEGCPHGCSCKGNENRSHHGSDGAQPTT